MLQLIITDNDLHPLPELAQMAIEAGCGWLQLRIPKNVSDGECRDKLTDIVEMCRESGTFLTVEDRPELAKELGMHGVHITGSFIGPSPIELREILGPEAVIGTDVSSPLEVLALKGKDIDYASVSTEMTSASRRAVISAGISEQRLPIVVSGNIKPCDVVAYLEEGVSGIASSMPSSAHDPITSIKELLNNMGQCQ